MVSGEQADDGLYIPIIDRVVAVLAKSGLLFLDDCKMSTWATRVHIRALGHHYLTPLALGGETAEDMVAWIEEALDGTHTLVPIYAPDAQAGDDPIGRGYERTRLCTAQEGERHLEWTEWVLIVHSPAYAEAQQQSLERRLGRATAKLNALIPPPDFPVLITEVQEAQGEQWVEQPAIADLYLKDKAGREYFFEIKSPRPNKGQCLEITEWLLRIHAIKQQNRPYVNAYAMAYNPYGARLEDYRHSLSLRYLDMRNEVLLGADLWTLIGGEGAYEELLDIYREMGREKGRAMIGALAFGLGWR